MIKKMNKTGAMAVSQILILIIGIFAFVYIVGNIGFVSTLATEALTNLPPGGLYGTHDNFAWVANPRSGLIAGPVPDLSSVVVPNQVAAPQSILEAGRTAGTIGGPGAPAAARLSWWEGVKASFFNKGGGAFLDVGAGAQVSWLSYASMTLAVAAVTAYAISLIVKTFGSERNAQNIAIAAYTSAGITAVVSIVAALPGVAAAGPAGWLVAATIVALTAIWGFATWQKYFQEVFTFQPLAWQAKDKGEDCGKCNELEYGCSEY